MRTVWTVNAPFAAKPIRSPAASASFPSLPAWEIQTYSAVVSYARIPFASGRPPAMSRDLSKFEHEASESPMALMRYLRL